MGCKSPRGSALYSGIQWNSQMHNNRTVLAYVVLIVLGLCLPLLAGDPNAPIKVEDYPHGPIKVACVGDSITEGSGATRNNSYPCSLDACSAPNGR